MGRDHAAEAFRSTYRLWDRAETRESTSAFAYLRTLTELVDADPRQAGLRGVVADTILAECFGISQAALASDTAKVMTTRLTTALRSARMHPRSRYQ